MNVDKIVITELKIGLISPDLTPGQSEMVVLRVPGYSSTEHAEWYHEGVLSVSGYCHLRIIIDILLIQKGNVKNMD